MTKLMQLRKKVETEYKRWASINYFVQSPVFKFVYDKLSDIDKKQLMDAVIKGDQQVLKNFVKSKKEGLEPFERLSYRKLRTIAKHLGLSYYSKMNKLELVEEIRYEVQRIKADSEQLINQS